jgi:hypothetical protein
MLRLAEKQHVRRHAHPSGRPAAPCGSSSSVCSHARDGTPKKTGMNKSSSAERRDVIFILPADNSLMNLWYFYDRLKFILGGY